MIAESENGSRLWGRATETEDQASQRLNSQRH